MAKKYAFNFESFSSSRVNKADSPELASKSHSDENELTVVISNANTTASQFHADVVKIAKTKHSDNLNDDDDDDILEVSYDEPSEAQLKSEDDLTTQIYLGI
jgi:hypothetical protein